MLAGGLVRLTTSMNFDLNIAWTDEMDLHYDSAEDDDIFSFQNPN